MFGLVSRSNIQIRKPTVIATPEQHADCLKEAEGKQRLADRDLRSFIDRDGDSETGIAEGLGKVDTACTRARSL